VTPLLRDLVFLAAGTWLVRRPDSTASLDAALARRSPAGTPPGAGPVEEDGVESGAAGR
jgi:hypothetical protein